MTFPRLRAFEVEWKRRPPVHWLAAGLAGYKPPETRPAAVVAPASVAALDAMFPGGRLRGG